MRTYIIITCFLFYVFGIPDWFAGSRYPLLCAMTYPLYHANMLHLSVNMICLYAVYSPQRKGKGPLLLCSWVLSCLVWPLAPHPVVGISNLLYASIGLITPVLRPGYWRQPAVILFYLMTFGMLFIPSVSGLSHITALAAGLLVSLFRMRN